MKKSLILLSSVMSMTLSSFSTTMASDAPIISPDDVDVSVAASTSSRAVASAKDVETIKRHMWSYAGKMGLRLNEDGSPKVKDVGQSTLCSCLRTSFNDAERYLLNNMAGQILARFLAIAMDDFADGKLDGIANGKKVSYAKEIADLLGVSVTEEELRSQPLEEPLAIQLAGFAVELGGLIMSNANDKDQLVSSLGAFAEEKMFRARKYLAAALILEADRIIALELGNGKVDGLDANGMAIDWKAEMQTSVRRAMDRVLDGVM